MLIGLLPTYQQIGVAAPILLLLLRIAQGIGLGGEWGGAVLMAYEYAPRDQRGFYASLPQIGLAIGLCLSSGVVAIMSSLPEEQFLSWGWRVGFLLSFVLVAVGLYIRLKILETPEFQQVKERGEEAKLPFVEMARNYPRNILLGMGARYIDGVFFNIFAVFSGQHGEISAHGGPVDGVDLGPGDDLHHPDLRTSQRSLGRPKTYAIGSFLLALSAYPAFWLLSSGSTPAIALGLIVPFGIIYAMCYGPEAALFADLFDARVRYTGISFVYQFSGIFASGLTPIIATWLLVQNGNQPWLICAYVVFAALVSMVCAMAIGRDRHMAERTAMPAETAKPIAPV